MNIEKLIASEQGYVDPSLVDHVRKTYGSCTAPIDESAVFAPGVRLGKNIRIGANVILEQNVEVDPNTKIDDLCHVQKEVRIGSGVVLFAECVVFPCAKICPDDVISMSTNARQIHRNSLIGPDVKLPNEVELGVDSIVPTQRTITTIGSFGSKNRMVTIYGSDDGPRYSVGCQIGIDLTTLEQRVVRNEATSVESAATYAPYMGVFEQIGTNVQREYEKSDELIDMLKSQSMYWNPDSISNQE